MRQAYSRQVDDTDQGALHFKPAGKHQERYIKKTLSFLWASQIYVYAGSFTVEEDKLIWDYVAERKYDDCNWKALVPLLKRSSAQIRQRYKTLRVFLQKHPLADLEQAPRRQWHCSNAKESEYQHLRSVADEFKHCSQIPTLADIKKRLRGGQESPTDEENYKRQAALPSLDVDELLTDFFSNSMDREFVHRPTTMGPPAINAST